MGDLNRLTERKKPREKIQLIEIDGRLVDKLMQNSSECANAFKTFFYIGEEIEQRISKMICRGEPPCVRVLSKQI